MSAPEAGCAARMVARRRRVYHSFYTPKTVQNPTDAMLLMLLAA
jgi:hypothetical protein